MSDEIKPAAPTATEEELLKAEEEKKLAEEAADKARLEAEESKSPYQEELERIEAERVATEERHKSELETVDEERKRQVAVKDKALADEKAKTKGVKEVWKEETLNEVERRLDLRDARVMVQGMTDDPTAQKVIIHHFETLPKELRQGTIKDQLITAMALANRNRISSLLNEDRMQDKADARSIASMGGGNLPGSSSFQIPPSAAARTASKLSSMYAGKDKELAKRLSEQASKHLSRR